MQFKIAQQMIQEVVNGKDADEVLATFVEGAALADDKPETANRLIDNFLGIKSE